MEQNIKLALERIIENSDTFRAIQVLQGRIARAMKKNPSTIFKGARTLSDYTSRMSKHLTKPACSSILVELKSEHKELFAD
jgi:hypothetical protein